MAPSDDGYFEQKLTSNDGNEFVRLYRKPVPIRHILSRTHRLDTFNQVGLASWDR